MKDNIILLFSFLVIAGLAVPQVYAQVNPIQSLGIWWIFLVIGIVIFVIAVLVIIWTWTPRTVKNQHKPAFQTEVQFCLHCGQPLRWVPQHQKYWCEREQKYI